MRRLGMMGLLGLCALGSGCAATATRDEINPMYKQSAWLGASVPAQTQTVMPPERTASVATANETARPQGFGLSKYFPGLKPATPDPTRLATNQRPSWFGLRRLRSTPASAASPVQSKVYETDARVALNRGATPSLLPVALQVPSSDPAVTPTSATQPSADAPKQAPDEAANPLPPSELPPSRMPALPPVDPQETPKAPVAPAAPAIDDAAPPDVRPTAVAMPVVETQAKAEPTPTADAMPLVETQAKVEPTPPEDDKAVKAVEPAKDPKDKDSLGLPEATVPASYFSHKAKTTTGNWITPPGMVLASPQSPPPAPKPTPQACAKPASTTPKWKQNALCRTFRKVMKMDETP